MGITNSKPVVVEEKNKDDKVDKDDKTKDGKDDKEPGSLKRLLVCILLFAGLLGIIWLFSQPSDGSSEYNIIDSMTYNELDPV